MKKSGISMVALVITIIVLIVLTSAVVITGVGAPQQAQLAVFKSNIATIQELVGIQMSENMITGALESKGNNYKWQGIVQDYDYGVVNGASPDFAVEPGKCNGQPVAHISTQLLSKTTLNANEYSKYYISEDGIVYHEGMTINGTTYYNENTVQTSEIYGIKRELTTSATRWERTDNSIGKNANATLYGVLTGTNDFDNIYPWSAIRSYNYDVENDTITAWYGDSNYMADGTNGDVLTYIPEFWYKRVQENGYEYIQISATQVDNTYTKSEAFSIARYETYIENGKSYSKSGIIPTTNINLTNFRTYATSTSDKYCLMDYRYFVIQLLYLVEYADYNSQAVLGNGYTFLSGANAVVQENGSCDSLGMKSGTPGEEKTTGVIYRGVENIFGNMGNWVDGVRVYNNQLYVSTNPDNYTSETSTTYILTHLLIGTLPNSSGWIKKIGYSQINPLIMYPIAVGGTDSTYIPDYYYKEAGDMAFMVGGRFDDNNYGGVWRWFTAFSPSMGNVGTGARLLKYQ